MRRWSVLFAIVLLVGCSNSKGGNNQSGDTSGRGTGVNDSGSQADDTSESPPEDTESQNDPADTETDDSGQQSKMDSGNQSMSFDCDNPDSDWLFCEDFEYGDGDWKTWLADSDFLNPKGGDDRGRIKLSDRHSTSGKWSVFMPASKDSNYRGAALSWYACKGKQEVNCDLKGYDKLYFRTRVRFAKDHDYVHHFLNIRGRDRFWAYGSAGCMPNGESAMGTTVDFEEDSHSTFFYTYHLDMSCDTNCGRYLNVDQRCKQCKDKGFPTCQNQKQCCWGNKYKPDPEVKLPTGEWFCLEMMMDANTPGKADGKMAYWVDGKPGHSVDGIRWRTTKDLQLNQAGLQHYIADGDADSPNRVWFDDVVVSTSRIGCPNR